MYAIGDIHGHHNKLSRALDLIARDGGENAPIVFLGDYVDRGPDSKCVLETLMEGVAQGKNWVVLRGNHDLIFRNFVENGALKDPARPNMVNYLHPRVGGQTTLRAYLEGTELATCLYNQAEITSPTLISELQEAMQAAVPKAHLAFLDALPNMHQTESHIFAHAGLRPGVALEDQSPADLLWIRDEWLKDTNDWGRLVVHGHTPRSRPRLYSNRLNTDGGAGFERELVPVRLEGYAAFALTEDGPQQLPVEPDRAR